MGLGPPAEVTTLACAECFIMLTPAATDVLKYTVRYCRKSTA